jgi:hypothetical protein
MVLIPVLCPYCHSDQVIKGGKTKAGKQTLQANALRAAYSSCSRYSMVSP